MPCSAGPPGGAKNEKQENVSFFDAKQHVAPLASRFHAGALYEAARSAVWDKNKNKKSVYSHSPTPTHTLSHTAQHRGPRRERAAQAMAACVLGFFFHAFLLIFFLKLSRGVSAPLVLWQAVRARC